MKVKTLTQLENDLIKAKEALRRGVFRRFPVGTEVRVRHGEKSRYYAKIIGPVASLDRPGAILVRNSMSGKTTERNYTTMVAINRGFL